LRPIFDQLSTFRIENLVSNQLRQSGHVEINAAGSQQVGWFVRVLTNGKRTFPRRTSPRTDISPSQTSGPGHLPCSS